MLLAEEHQLSPGAALGPYVVEAYIASGATSSLYRVRHPPDGHTFAAKVMGPAVARDPFMRERFATEAEVLKVFDHPHIVRLHDVLTTPDGDPAFIMEYVDGSTLEAYIPLHPGGLSEVLTLSIAIQILDALAYAHARGVVHRDLKPENILLEQDHFGGLKAYVADFGLAKILDAHQKTATGLRLGTIAYMAPEQVRDSSRVDPRADIYALGVTLYECLTGALPFPQASLREVLAAHLTTPIPPVRNQRLDLSPDWDRIIARACAKDRDHRYPDAPTMLADIGKLSRSLSLDERTTQALAPIRPLSTRDAHPTAFGRPGPSPSPLAVPAAIAAAAAAPFDTPDTADALDTSGPDAPDPNHLGVASTVEMTAEEISGFIATRSMAPLPPTAAPSSPDPNPRADGPLFSWAFTHNVPQDLPKPPAPPRPSPKADTAPKLLWAFVLFCALAALCALAWALIP